MHPNWWPFSSSIPASLVTSLWIHWGMLMAVGLKLENVSVPRSGIFGGSVTLGCDYLLESDTLLSLKWYRDGHEFFRFIPANYGSRTTTFNLPGVHVDQGESLKVEHGRVRLKLKNLDLSSGGIYKCEILADSPSFQTLHEERNFSVMALPDSPKVILTGFPPTAQFAEKINGSCTFPDSYPAAELTLYLNNDKVITNSSRMEIAVFQFPPIRVGHRLTSKLGVKFRIAPKLFHFGVLQIKCIAQLLDQTWEASRNITLENYRQTFFTAGQNQYSAASNGLYQSARKSCHFFTIITLLVSSLGLRGNVW